jgi:hypothetical protein
MTPTIEERAQEVIRAMTSRCDAADMFPEWIALISQAIREAEDAAYERAAAVADDDRTEISGAHSMCIDTIPTIGARIRSLKSPKEV